MCNHHPHTGSQSKHQHLNNLPIPHFITLNYDMKRERRPKLNTGQKNSLYSGRPISTQRSASCQLVSSSSSVQWEWDDINSGENNCSYTVSVGLLYGDCQPGNHGSWLFLALSGTVDLLRSLTNSAEPSPELLQRADLLRHKSRWHLKFENYRQETYLNSNKRLY